MPTMHRAFATWNIVLLSYSLLSFFATQNLLARNLHLIQENRTKLQAQNVPTGITDKRHMHTAG